MVPLLSFPMFLVAICLLHALKTLQYTLELNKWKQKPMNLEFMCFTRKALCIKQRLLHLYKLGNLWTNIGDLNGLLVVWDNFLKYQDIIATCINLSYVYSHHGFISILHFVFKNLPEKQKQKEAYLIQQKCLISNSIINAECASVVGKMLI